jgi:flavin-dependent dehydrogenase
MSDPPPAVDRLNASSHPTAERRPNGDPTDNTDADHYDVVVIGGAFSGAATAILLKRWLPEAKVAVVEKAPTFDRKVGEATVEISSLMLHRVLGLSDVLARDHLAKHGLRYWFADRPDRTLAEMSEVGPGEVARLPAYQLDRSKLDETLLAKAVAAGAELIRPAAVEGLELNWPVSRLAVTAAGTERRLSARWVIDASGRHAFIARRLRLLQRVEEHPTAAVWGRWTGVLDMDGPEVTGSDPRRPMLPHLAAARRQATNHFCGYGWWCWLIPLAGGETSVGLVYDKRFFSWPTEGSLKERYLDFLRSTPGVRELLAPAELDEDDFRSYAHLPYRTERYAERGWAAVGDAAAFMDPFYSPGLDHASLSAYATARLVEDDLAGRLDEAALGEAVEEHNRQFLRSYRRWLGALYIDKYETFGDAELTAAGFLMDTALYYMGVVTEMYRDVEALRYPVFGQPLPQAAFFFRFIRFYNRRLVQLARQRRCYGTYGRRNAGWRCFVEAPGLGRTGATGMFNAGFKLWLKAELECLGHRLRHGDLFRSFPQVRTAEPSQAGAGTAA